MVAAAPVWFKQFIKFSAVSFVGLGLSRIMFPQHFRGCQCDRPQGTQAPQISGTECPDKYA